MGVGADEPCPLPEDPRLADVAAALRDTGQAAWIVDDAWRFVHVTDDARALWIDKRGGQLGSVAIGDHVFSAASLQVGADWRFGLTTPELWRDALIALGGLVLADAIGARQDLRAVVDPALREVVDGLAPCEAEMLGCHIMTTGLHGPAPSDMLAVRVRDGDGRLHGTALIGKPTTPMSVLGGMAWQRDLPHLERMERFTRAGRHPAAILFADLERSSALIRTMPTATYFTLGRRLVRAADQCVIDAGGLVGRHLGDGVVAFFPSETSGSEAAAARACVVTARNMQRAVRDVARRTELDPDALVLRIGLHWGSTVFIGKISTTARVEVTALGDEVNSTARIEACAAGGRILASQHLVERLDADDAWALGIDRDHLAYSPLGDLPTATPKARRDAPAIAVCEL